MSPASRVSAIPAASSNAALSYFEDQFRYETDCWDVHDALSNGPQDFVLLDVRGTEKYQAGHVAGALDLAHGKIIASKLAAYPPIRCSWCIARARTAMAQRAPPCGWRNWAARQSDAGRDYRLAG
jgi:hypothetical protein